jgi:hypothetical protein
MPCNCQFRPIARELHSALAQMLADTDPDDAHLEPIRDLHDRTAFRFADQPELALGFPVAAHGCHCHEDETE